MGLGHITGKLMTEDNYGKDWSSWRGVKKVGNTRGRKDAKVKCTNFQGLSSPALVGQTV